MPDRAKKTDSKLAIAKAKLDFAKTIGKLAEQVVPDTLTVEELRIRVAAKKYWFGVIIDQARQEGFSMPYIALLKPKAQDKSFSLVQHDGDWTRKIRGGPFGKPISVRGIERIDAKLLGVCSCPGAVCRPLGEERILRKCNIPEDYFTNSGAYRLPPPVYQKPIIAGPLNKHIMMDFAGRIRSWRKQQTLEKAAVEQARRGLTSLMTPTQMAFCVYAPYYDREFNGLFTLWILRPKARALSVAQEISLAALLRVVTAFTVERREVRDELVRSKTLADLGTIASGLTYELRHRLQGLATSIDSLARLAKGSRSKVRTHVSRGKAIVRDTNRILTDLLEYARGYEIELKLESTDMNTLIESVLDELGARISKEVEVVKNLKASLPEVMIDRTRIRHVLWDMIINALEAMKDHGKLQLSTRERGDSIEIEIADTGPGIDSKHLNRIFRPFETSKYQGIGLGLAVSKRIVTAHHGAIEVRSGPRKKTIFRIKLPKSSGEGA